MPMKNTCLKCKEKYHDKMGEDYLCASCLKEKRSVADDIDKKFNTVGQQPTGIKVLEEQMKIKGGFAQSPDGKNSRLMISINDAGIIL